MSVVTCFLTVLTHPVNFQGGKYPLFVPIIEFTDCIKNHERPLTIQALSRKTTGSSRIQSLDR